MFAGQRRGLDGAVIGLLALCFMATDTVSNLMWGRVGDRHGYRLVFILSVSLWIATTMSQQTLVLEYGSRDEVAIRLGLASTIDGAGSALGPLVAGLVATQFGYQPLFAASILLLGLSLAVPARSREPRRR